MQNFTGWVSFQFIIGIVIFAMVTQRKCMTWNSGWQDVLTPKAVHIFRMTTLHTKSMQRRDSMQCHLGDSIQANDATLTWLSDICVSGKFKYFYLRKIFTQCRAVAAHTQSALPSSPPFTIHSLGHAPLHSAESQSGQSHTPVFHLTPQ